MAFPQVGSESSGTQTSDSTSWTLTYPSGIQAGDLLIVIMACDGLPTPITITDFDTLGDTPAASNLAVLAVRGKVATGSESGNFTATLNAAEQGCWRVLRITAGTWYGGTVLSGQAVDAGGSASGTSTAPDPVNNPAVWGQRDNLFIAMSAADHGDTTHTGFPTNYSNTSSQESGGANGAALGVARRENYVAAEDPSAFTIDQSEEWAAAVYVIRPTAVGDPTLVCATGFEHGSVAASPGTTMFLASAQIPDGVNGTPTVETSIVHHGTKALRITATTAQSCNWYITVSGSRIIGVVYFYIVSMVTSVETQVVSVSTSTGGSSAFRIATDGTIKARPAGDSAADVSGPTLTTGVWYRLDFDIDTSGTQHVMKWRVDKVAQGTATSTNSPGAGNLQVIALGTPAAAQGNATFVYDCLAWSYRAVDYPLPELYMLGYVPDGDTDISQMGSGSFVDAAGTAISAGNPAWDNLDSRDFDQSAERVEQQSLDAAALIEVSFENSSESVAPHAVMAEGAFRADTSTACNIQARLRSGTNEDTWGSGDPSESTNVKGWKIYLVEPTSLNQWTDTLFDALRMRFGYSNDATPDPWVTALMLEAAFIVPDAAFNPATQGAGIFQPESYDLQVAE